MTAVREYLIPQRFRLELCPNWWVRGNSFCGTPNVATLLSLESKLYGRNRYCVEAICNSLCEFVLKEQHVRFVSLFFREHQKALLFSPVPCQILHFILIYYLLIPVLFSLQVTKEYVENQKPCSLFCSLCSLVFLKNWPKDNKPGVWILITVLIELLFYNSPRLAVLTFQKPKCIKQTTIWRQLETTRIKVQCEAKNPSINKNSISSSRNTN